VNGRRRGALASAWVVALMLAACSSTNKPGLNEAPPPSGGGGAEGERGGASKFEEAEPATYADPGEELDALHARVDAAWGELEVLDDAREKAATASPDVAASRCDRIRGLADEICTLSDRMCTLASEHPGQARYVDACTRSGETCRLARQAAERCPAA
jgi:hypothetical protein